MAKGKGRTAASHIDNYRRGGLRLGNLGGRWLARQDITPQEILNGMMPQQGGEGMNGMNNPLGALSALAGLAQSKNDPMAALSALSALSGGSAGGAAAQTNSTTGAGASTNPADLINILSKLKPQGGKQTPPPNNNANSGAANANNGNNTSYQGNQQVNQDNSGYSNPPPYGSNQGSTQGGNQAGGQSTQAYRQGNQNGRQNQQEQSSPPPRRQGELRQRAQRLFAEEPKSGCEGCARNCGGNFRNYPKWSDINSAAAPWRKKGEHND